MHRGGGSSLGPWGEGSSSLGSTTATSPATANVGFLKSWLKVRINRNCRVVLSCVLSQVQDKSAPDLGGSGRISLTISELESRSGGIRAESESESESESEPEPESG